MARPSMRTIVPCLALALAAPWAGAQDEAEPPQTFAGDVEVRLVEVEVHVTDRKGTALQGLGAEDFKLEVNGEVREVEFFEPPVPPSASSEDAVGDTDPSASPEPGKASGEEKPLYLALYVDRRFIEPGELENARPLMASYLRNSLKPQDRLLLATADDEGLQVLQSYTTDHESVIARIDEIEGHPDGGRLAANIGALVRGLNQEMRLRNSLELSPGLDPAAAAGGGEQLDPDGASARVQRQGGDPRALLMQIETFSDRINVEIGSVAQQLGRLVGSLAGLPGRKQVLYMGGALPVQAPLDLFQAWQDIYYRPFNDSDYFRSSEREEGLNQRFQLDDASSRRRYMAGPSMFKALAQAASASDVAFHTVNVAPARQSRRLFSSPADVDVGSGGVDQSNLSAGTTGRGSVSAEDGLKTLSRITGGHHTDSPRKLQNYFSTLAGDPHSRYVLGFTADPQAGQNQEIQVKLKKKKGDRSRRRAQIRHRTHFKVKGRRVELAEKTLSHLMMDTEVENPLAVSVEVGAPEARAEDWRLQIKVKVPLSSLSWVPDRRSHSGKLSIYATAGALSEGFAPVMQTEVPVRVANRDVLTALGRVAEYELDLRVPRDPGRVAVTVRDELAASVSTVTAEVGKAEWLDVPDAGAGPPGDSTEGSLP